MYLQFQSLVTKRGNRMRFFFLKLKLEIHGAHFKASAKISIESYGFSSTGHRKNCKFEKKLRKNPNPQSHD